MRARAARQDEAVRVEIDELRSELVRAYTRIVNWSGADIDPLLEILNCRGFERELARAIAYVARYSMPAVLMLVDSTTSSQ